MKSNKKDVINELEEAANTMEQYSFDKKPINQETLSQMEAKPNYGRLKLWTFIASTACICIIICLSIMVNVVSNRDNMRYSDITVTNKVSLSSKEDILNNMPESQKFCMNIDGLDFETAQFYNDNKNKLLAISLLDSLNNSLFIIINQNFDYSEAENYKSSDAVVEIENKVTKYTTQKVMQRSLVTTYLLCLDSNSYDYYLYIVDGTDNQITNYTNIFMANLK